MSTTDRSDRLSARERMDAVLVAQRGVLNVIDEGEREVLLDALENACFWHVQDVSEEYVRILHDIATALGEGAHPFSELPREVARLVRATGEANGTLTRIKELLCSR